MVELWDDGGGSGEHSERALTKKMTKKIATIFIKHKVTVLLFCNCVLWRIFRKPCSSCVPNSDAAGQVVLGCSTCPAHLQEKQQEDQSSDSFQVGLI